MKQAEHDKDSGAHQSLPSLPLYMDQKHAIEKNSGMLPNKSGDDLEDEPSPKHMERVVCCPKLEQMPSQKSEQSGQKSEHSLQKSKQELEHSMQKLVQKI